VQPLQCSLVQPILLVGPHELPVSCLSLNPVSLNPVRSEPSVSYSSSHCSLLPLGKLLKDVCAVQPHFACWLVLMSSCQWLWLERHVDIHQRVPLSGSSSHCGTLLLGKRLLAVAVTSGP
jgi:hypothetical protein